MRVQRRWLAGALALALVAMPAWAEIKVGMVAPFSGAASSLGEGMKRGIEARFAEVNEARGVHGESLTLVS